MKEQIHTSPVAEAFVSQDECPFCRLERDAEHRAIRFFVGPGASYMEPEIRGITNRKGFCACHTKKLYDYGNALGSALILQTHMEDILLQLQTLSENREIPEKKGLFRKKPEEKQTDWQQLQQRVSSCAICDQLSDSVQRHYRVFFSLLKDAEFRGYVERCNGFCLPHFVRLLQEAENHLPASQAAWFYPVVYRVMEENLQRVKSDLDLLIRKYDYRNAALPWDNARDSLQRSMQKLSGIYPADPPYRKD